MNQINAQKSGECVTKCKGATLNAAPLPKYKCKFLFDGNFACVATCIGVYREYINTLGE